MKQEYTVLEIAKEALTRYRITETETMLDTVVKKIRKIINAQQFEATGMKNQRHRQRNWGERIRKKLRMKLFKTYFLII